MKLVYLLNSVLLLACNVAALSSDLMPIELLNLEIESQTVDTYSGDTSEIENRLVALDKLSAQCEGHEYISGDVQILHLKVVTAMLLGRDELLNEWQHEYAGKVETSIEYGLLNWELYYKSLELILSIYINGFERFRSSLEDLIIRSEIAGASAIQSVLLLEIISHADEQEDEEYITELDESLHKDDNLSVDLSYFNYLLLVGNYYASLDSTERALKNYSQADSVATRIGLNRFSRSTQFLSHLIKTENLPLSPDDLTLSLDYIEEMMQHEFLGDVSSEVLRVADSHITYEHYTEAEELLINCLQHLEEEFVQSKHYLDNVASSRYVQMRSTVSTDEMQAEMYYLLYNKLAVCQAWQGKVDQFFENMDIAVEYAKDLGYSEWVLSTYLEVVHTCDAIQNWQFWTLYIERACITVETIDDDDCTYPPCKVYWQLRILELYIDQGFLSVDARNFNRAIQLAENTLLRAKATDNMQYLYEALLATATLHNLANNQSSKAYSLFKGADSLSTHHDLVTNYSWEQCAWPLYVQFKDFTRLRNEISEHFDHFLQEEDYRYIVKDLLVQWYAWVCLQTSEDRDWDVYYRMIDQLYSLVETEDLTTTLNLKMWCAYLYSEFLKSSSSEGILNFDGRTQSIFEGYRKIRPEDLDEFDWDMILDYLDVGLSLLRYLSQVAFEDYHELLLTIEPVVWDANDLERDSWFLQFVYGTNGWFDDQLYKKYVTRILSYELCSTRLENRFFYAGYLHSLGDISQAIEEYKIALLESKQLSLMYHEVEILTALGGCYRDNRQTALAKRRLMEAKDLAKEIGYSGYFDTIYCELFDDVLTIDDDNYLEVLRSYLVNSSTQNLPLGQIQALGSLVHYYSQPQFTDSEKLIDYMNQGFHLRKVLFNSGSELRYFFFLDKCLDAIDISPQLIPFVLNYFSGAVVSDERIVEICENLEFFKDADLGDIIEENRQQFPFVYLNVLDAQDYLRSVFDGRYLQTDQFRQRLAFLLELGGDKREWGVQNAVWSINKRIKQIESYQSVPAYTGFGFQYDVQGAELIVTNVWLGSPASEYLIPGDRIFELQSTIIPTSNVAELLGDLSLHQTNTEFNVSRNGSDTLTFRISPGKVQPNVFAKEPIEEITFLLDKFLSISDSLIATADNIRSYPGFLGHYREFLMYYPYRIQYGNPEPISSELLTSTLNRYEDVATTNLIYSSLKHADILNDNPILMREYRRYTDRISHIQRELSSCEEDDDENLQQLIAARRSAYLELEYFADYSLESKEADYSASLGQMSLGFEELDQFDLVYRFCSTSYLNNVVFTYSENEVGIGVLATEEELAVQIKAAKQAMSFSATSSSSHSVKMMNEALLKLTKSIFGFVPVLQNPEEKRSFLVVAEGALNLFPFEALLVKFASDTTEYHHLSEAATITYAPSLASYLQFKHRDDLGQVNSEKALLVAANPATHAAQSYMSNILATRSGDLGSIEHVDDEIVAINEVMTDDHSKSLLQEIVIMGSSNISEQIFKQEISENIRYLHIAAHGVHDFEDPRYSGILLGRNSNDTEDGILQAHEIYPLDIRADLVVLSSCFSGFGEIDPNEGNLGIYRSFLIAGANSVIVSLWNVEDESTSILFAKFYEYLSTGKSKTEALNLARLYLMEETDFSHPFYWAPFVLYGVN